MSHAAVRLPFVSDVAWGTFPDWIAAIGTAGAFAAGGVLLVKELRVQRARDEDSRRAQASKVTAWAGESVSSVTTPGGPTRRRVRTHIRVRNASDQPVYSCGVTIHTGLDFEPAYVPGLVPPDTKLEGAVDWDLPDEAGPYLSSPGGEAQVTLTFRDSSGRMWKRGPEGILESFEHDHIFSDESP